MRSLDVSLEDLRDRSVLHIEVGSGDWIPSPEDLANFRNLFLTSDMDPMSAIVATRNLKA